MSLQLVVALSSLLPALCEAQALWTRTLPVHGLAGAGDIVASVTAGGVVLWNLSTDRSQVVTVGHGLPSHVGLAATLAPDRDELCVATANGLARGWFQPGWRSVGARNDERGMATYSTLCPPGRACFAGGDEGLLFRWDGSRLDSLRIPSPQGRVVSLAWFRAWLDARSPRSHPATVQHDGTPLFPVGLAAAIDNDGLWLLRDSGSLVRWLRFVEEDGLPSHRTRHALTDSQGRLWVATDRGIAWIDEDLKVHSLAHDPLGAQRTHVLLEADGHLFAGTDLGLLRISLADPGGPIEFVETIPGPIVALARTHDALWVSDGWSIVNLAGQRLDLPFGLQDNFCLASLENRGVHWIGHPAGRITVGGVEGWWHLGPENGLPRADITHFLPLGDELFVGTAGAGLYVTPVVWRRPVAPEPPVRRQKAIVEATSADGLPLGKALPAPLSFSPVPGAPASITAQAHARGIHWVGGREGLFQRQGVQWQSFPLWPGATEVAGLCSAGDTLWASAGHAGVGYHDGRRWITPTRPPGYGFAACGALQPGADGRVAIATDRGLLLWNGLGLQCDPGSPDLYLTDVAWWNDCLACGTHQGLWIRHSTGNWDTLGVLDGLPGARVRSLHVDANGGLWIASTRGVGRLDASFCLASGQPGWRTPEPALPHRRTLIPLGTVGVERLDVFDARGRLVQRLDRPAGLDWERGLGKSLPAGVYFVRFPPGRRSARIVVLR